MALDGTDFVDTDLRTSGGSSPRLATASQSMPGGTGRAPTREELDSQLTATQQDLAKLREAQEQLERALLALHGSQVQKPMGGFDKLTENSVSKTGIKRYQLNSLLTYSFIYLFIHYIQYMGIIESKKCCIECICAIETYIKYGSNCMSDFSTT
jgi:hypothetical protein